MNIIDLIIILYLIYVLVIGFYRGFLRQSFDLGFLILSFFLAFKLYSPLGNFIFKQFGLTISYANVLSFFIIWFLVELLYNIFFMLFYGNISESLKKSKFNRYLGLLPALLRGLISIWIILSLILILPISKSWRDKFDNSLLSRPFMRLSSVVEKNIGDIFGSAIDETVKFLTIKPESNEKIELGFRVTNGTIDSSAENEMLRLVNLERTSRGLKPLTMDSKLRDVARAHSRDMLKKGYFAHQNLEGQSPFDRMDKAGVEYFVAGENLALAPNVQVAHQGLMNSPGHKANILTPEFRKVGIGVINAGKYGEMFSQEFTD